jgi:hypothetical protein
MDVQFLWLHARQSHAAHVLLGFFVHIRFYRGSNIERLLELRQLKTPRLAGQNAIKHLVELATKTKQVLEQLFIGVQISHILPCMPLHPEAAVSLESMAAAGGEAFLRPEGPVRRTYWRFNWTSSLTAAFERRILALPGQASVPR